MPVAASGGEFNEAVNSGLTPHSGCVCLRVCSVTPGHDVVYAVFWEVKLVWWVMDSEDELQWSAGILASIEEMVWREECWEKFEQRVFPESRCFCPRRISRVGSEVGSQPPYFPRTIKQELRIKVDRNVLPVWIRRRNTCINSCRSWLGAQLVCDAVE